MATLTQLNSETLELDSETPHEQSWLGGGCLLIALGGIFGLAALAQAADGPRVPIPWFGEICLLIVVLGVAVTWLGFQLQESYLIRPTGIHLRRRWLGGSHDHLLTRKTQIHCLALDGSDRLPRSWRLMLVGCDGQTRELAGYSLKEHEEERWSEVCELGNRVASTLSVPFLLPEGQEREWRLEADAGPPLSVYYTQCLKAVDQEIKDVLVTALGFGAFLAVVVAARMIWLAL
jgi:hypothetical protein